MKDDKTSIDTIRADSSLIVPFFCDQIALSVLYIKYASLFKISPLNDI